MSDMSNGKTYTEVLLDVYAKIDTVEQRVTEKLDAVIRDNSEYKASLAAGDEKFASMDRRIDENSSEIKKVRNLNTGIALLASTIAGILGVNR